MYIFFLTFIKDNINFMYTVGGYSIVTRPIIIHLVNLCNSKDPNIKFITNKLVIQIFNFIFTWQVLDKYNYKTNRS